MPRRLLAAAVAGALALLGLTACRDLPSVAAYVGDAQLTNAQVDQMVTEARTNQPDAPAAGDLRQFAVQVFVIHEVSTRLAKEHKLTVPPADPAQVATYAQQLKVANGALVRQYVDAVAAYGAIQPLGTPQEPTDADKREVFASLIQQQVVTPDQYDQVKAQIDSPEMRARLGLRAVLRDALSRYRVTVNPRYQPLELSMPFTLANITATVSVPLGYTAPVAVTDVSSPQS